MIVVSAVIVRDNAVLLVSGTDPATNNRVWMLPGGKVKAGELPHEALRREVAEETSLAIADAGRLAWLTYGVIRDGDAWRDATAYAFAVPDPGGAPSPSPAERNVGQAAFVDIREGTSAHLAGLPPNMRDPAIAFLTGAAGAGTAWFSRHDGPHSVRDAVPRPSMTTPT